MRFVSPYLHYRAAASTDAAATAAAMSSRFPYRGRDSRTRGFSERSGDGGDGFVSGDSHFRAVGQANYGFRRGGGNALNNGEFPGQPFQPRGPSSGPSFQRGPPSRQPRQRADDHRSWRFVVPGPPPHWERFVVVSYNILSDYLAWDHRGRLYFHIPRYILDWKWREKSIMFELGLWDPDVMCFQEVDRFQDLEEKLKQHGYRGIWKMRTGKPVDGCAIFWRCSRFHLLHEESIEFAQFGLRDNVAQICVLELRSQSSAQNSSVLPDSSLCSEHAYKVVVCNIHVLYNPNRGDIKLGQVRILLDRAYAISRTWNDAPVVLCGDFNCTPKSPLYNFINQQKLNLSGLAKNEVSGQSSAAIQMQGSFGPNYGARLPPDDSISVYTLVDGQNIVNPETSRLGYPNKQHKEDNDVCFRGHLENPQSSSSVLSGTLCNGSVSAAEVGNTHCNSVVNSILVMCCKGRHSSTCKFVSLFIESKIMGSDNPTSDTTHFHTHQLCMEMCRKSDVQISFPKNHLILISAFMQDGLNSVLDNRTANLSEDTSLCSIKDWPPSSFIKENDIYCSKEESQSLHIDRHNISSDSNQSSVGEGPGISNASCNTGSSSHCPNNDHIPGKQIMNKFDVHIAGGEDISFKKSGFLLDQGDNAFSDSSLIQSFSPLPELSNEEKVCELSVEIGESSFEKSDDTPSDCLLEPDSIDLENSSFHPMSQWIYNMQKETYDPYIWTPEEIATASGSAEYFSAEHPMKLKSTYAEVEDYVGTKDASGEPQVTSYNRQFMGTVDYIWCSEGLQTVKVLDTIPKHVLQKTRGYPTRKWGSDHLALACQLAFVKGTPSGEV